ncbi:MutS protein msh5 [Ascosphaera pollenicola]|nr:MutS protein msh5 [Ascosphaera pollenicola]
MAKKRKASSGPKAAPPVQTRFTRNETFDNSEDEFETGRDQILLEEAPDAKRRRKLQEDEEIFQESDQDVGGYVSPSDDEEDFDEGDFDEEEEEERSFRKRKISSRDMSSDDEEQKDGEEGYTGWGSSKKDYYDADVIETEADALEEEEEAKKLQTKRLQSLKEDDFGIDEEDWLMAGKGEDQAIDKDDQTTTEIAVNLELSDDMPLQERRKILHQRYPEFKPLSKDLLELQPLHQELAAIASQTKQSDPLDPAPLAVVKFRALTAYLAAVSAYFFLLTSPSRKGETKIALSPAELREHPVMEALVHTKTQWEEVRHLESYDSESDEEMDKDVAESVTESEIDSAAEETETPDETPKATKQTKIERAIEAARAKAEEERKKKLEKTEAELADLSKQLKQQKATKKARLPGQAGSDFGDETHLEDYELAEKAAKKKSLRFYTSQIDQKANKRGSAGRDAGGDMDLPYRERLRDRQARLLAQAEKRGREAPDVLGGESDEEDHRVARELRNEKSKDDGSDSDDYYDMVASRAKSKKDEKKKRAEAHAEALKQSRHVEVAEEIGPDGKRAITYAIQKNKGLTPKRNKDVRNPRVKKRKKFAEKQKKLGSIRQIYKGGEGRGGYGGEATGIKTNVVKSVKL